MQNDKCKSQNAKSLRRLPATILSHFAFCIEHFAFCILHFLDSRLNMASARGRAASTARVGVVRSQL
jgi:hypothetical protein